MAYCLVGHNSVVDSLVVVVVAFADAVAKTVKTNRFTIK